MSKIEKITTTVRLPVDIDQKIRQVAQSERSSVNRVVVVALERYIRAWEGRQSRAGASGDAR